MLISNTKGYGARKSAAASPNTAPSRPESRRSCVGCGQKVSLQQARGELMRLVLVPRESDGRPTDFDVVVDLACGSSGRGAWLHTRSECLSNALKKGLARAARGRVHATSESLCKAICAAAERRAAGLINSAVRARVVSIGGEAVADSLAANRVVLLLVAKDAAAAAKTTAVMQAQQRGLAMMWSDKAGLGAMLGRREVAVIAITERRLAAPLGSVIACWETFAVEGPSA